MTTTCRYRDLANRPVTTTCLYRDPANRPVVNTPPPEPSKAYACSLGRPEWPNCAICPMNTPEGVAED